MVSVTKPMVTVIKLYVSVLMKLAKDLKINQTFNKTMLYTESEWNRQNSIFLANIALKFNINGL